MPKCVWNPHERGALVSGTSVPVSQAAFAVSEPWGQAPKEVLIAIAAALFRENEQ